MQLLGDDCIHVSWITMCNSQSTGPCLPCGPHPPMQPENGALGQGRIRRRPVGILRLGLNSVLFCVAAAFFCGLVPGEPGGDGVWVRQPSAVWQQKRSACPRRTRDLCAVLSFTRFAVGSALSIDSGLRAPSGSPATLWGVTAGGPAPPESRRSGRRSAPHTIRLLFEVGSSFCRLPCFARAKVFGCLGQGSEFVFVPAPLLPVNSPLIRPAIYWWEGYLRFPWSKVHHPEKTHMECDKLINWWRIAYINSIFVGVNCQRTLTQPSWTLKKKVWTAYFPYYNM